MKKFYTLMVALMALVTTATAQSNDNKWGVGVRLGGALEIVGRYSGFGEVADKPMYLEARLGTGLNFIPNGTLIAAWECVNFGDSAVGDFSFDAGVAANAGGLSPTDFFVHAGPMVRLDYTFKKVPVSLGIDWTPYMGIMSGFITCHDEKYPLTFSWEPMVINFALSCTYNF
ncbi:MAG: hypothetical protein IJ014_02140 [Rikenellaceae bacterium]|nr:hypothetical protein [Rikenellaceae bacterium]